MHFIHKMKNILCIDFSIHTVFLGVIGVAGWHIVAPVAQSIKLNRVRWAEGK